MNPLIPAPRSVIVSIDSDELGFAEQVAYELKDVPGIGAYKFGFQIGISARINRAVRNHVGDKAVLIYDHQKAGNDIPEMGPKFARQVKEAGFDAAILFPFAGPKTQEVWTKSCQDVGLHVLVGGIMTHEQFLASEGGYIDDHAPERIFRLACKMGVQDFVVPGTKIRWVNKLRVLLDEELGEGNFVLYAPGFITQGGDLNECALAAGPSFHAIIGSAISGKASAEERIAAAKVATSKLLQ
jgi:orotidine-5'-phosphate decarboxylase